MAKQEIISDILFDGYCPESALKGKKVAMRLNKDDFWESVATGLQISTFPPYAAILLWRGSGQLRESPETATKYHNGLILTKASTEKGKEIFPDGTQILDNSFDLEQYIISIHTSEQEYHVNQFNSNDPLLKAQGQYLETIATEDWMDLIGLYKEAHRDGPQSEAFVAFQQKLYNLKVVFNFDWMNWIHDLKNLHASNFDASKVSLLLFSMYITAIFRSNRFFDGSIEQYMANGMMDQLMERLEHIT